MTTKNLLLYIVFSIALCTQIKSCTQDDFVSINTIDEFNLTLQNENMGREESKNLVSNNPYDYLGAVHNQILTTYLSNQQPNLNLKELQMTIHKIMQEYDLSAPSTFSFLEIQELINIPESVWNSTISTSELSLTAISLLGTLRDTMIYWDFQNLEDTATDWIDFENDILQDLNLTQEEKRIMLTLSTIIKHSVEYKKGRDDKDWDISVGNFSGALKGAITNSDSAIALAIIVGLLNQKDQILKER